MRAHQMTISTIDLNFCDIKGCIDTYLLPQALTTALSDQGIASRDVTHILPTHIHLDHAGAADWFAGHGAQVYVHPVGVPHMLNYAPAICSARNAPGKVARKFAADASTRVQTNYPNPFWDLRKSRGAFVFGS
jgi:glyoxylase-like metal-dependent hydrolase (beta-lactamase superfamily II)